MRFITASLTVIAALSIGILRSDFEKIDHIDWPEIERSDFSMSSVPKWLLDMQGQPVRMRGVGCSWKGGREREFLFAPESNDGKFVHWWANWELVPVHYAIHVTLGQGRALPSDRLLDEIQVEGVFRIEPFCDSNGQLMMLYHIDQATVIESDITPGYSASRGRGC